MRSRPPGPGSDLSRSDRRTFLRGAVGLVGAGVVGATGLASLTGCGMFSRATPQPHPLEGFLAATLELAGRYEATIAAVPDLAAALSPIWDAHLAHAGALADAIGVASPTPAPAAAAGSAREPALRALAAAETEARDEAVAECLSAGSWLAPLLGAIAAARACHIEVVTP